MRRTHSGGCQHSLRIIRASDVKRDEDFDPCVSEWSDPDKITDAKLKRMLCSAGSVEYCPRCEVFDCCQYGRELIRREKRRESAKQAKLREGKA